MTRYNIKIELLREMLGTNALDPHVLDTHIHKKQRDLIMGISKVNKEIAKYTDAIAPSEEKTQAELEALLHKLEEMVGYEFSEDQKELLLAGKLKELKECFKEFDVKGTTVFFWNNELGRPMIGDHMIYGFMKAASTAICRTKPKKNGTILQSDAYTCSIINTHVRCSEPFIVMDRDIMRHEDGSANFIQRSLRGMTAQGPRVSLAKSERVPAGTKAEFTLNVMRGSPLTEAHLKEIFEYGEFFQGLGQWRNSGRGLFKSEITCVEKGLLC